MQGFWFVISLYGRACPPSFRSGEMGGGVFLWADLIKHINGGRVMV